jgi:TolB-like protein/Tfp pilus assembly protein PilF
MPSGKKGQIRKTDLPLSVLHSAICKKEAVTRMGVFQELKRRNVFRVAGVYIVVGWVLVQVATALEESLELPNWFDGTIVALLLIGLPVAVIFAWAFEMTPDGVVKTETVPEGESITSETGRKLDFALALGIVALIIVIVWQQSTAPEQVPVEAAATDTPAIDLPAASTVAVLPFADMSPAGDQQYFSDGLSEEILNLLVRAEGLDVVSRTSSFQFKNTTLGIPDIATQLKVRHIVEGSVRQAGGNIRVTAQLIDAQSDLHLWSNTYDRPLTAENVFEIQDDVANSIFIALGKELGLTSHTDIKAKRKTDDLDAYALFLQARALYLDRMDLDVVDQLLAQAIEIDPDFSEAWEYRAATQFLMYDYGYSDLSFTELQDLGLEYAEYALSLDPNSATAIAAIGNIYTDQAKRLTPVHSWSEILATFTQALEIDPRNGSALNWRGLAYSWVGDIDAAIADFRQCQEYEPFYAPCVENLHWFLASHGRDAEALQVLYDALDAGIVKIYFAHLPLLARAGHEVAFKIATNDALALRGWRRHDELYEAFRDLDADHTELANSVAEFLAAAPGRSRDFAETTVLALGFVPTEVSASLIVWGKIGAKFRTTSEFKDLIKRSGILAYWDEIGYPEFCRPVGSDDFECD